MLRRRGKGSFAATSAAWGSNQQATSTFFPPSLRVASGHSCGLQTRTATCDIFRPFRSASIPTSRFLVRTRLQAEPSLSRFNLFRYCSSETQGNKEDGEADDTEKESETEAADSEAEFDDPDYPGPDLSANIDVSTTKTQGQNTFVSSHFQLSENEVFSFLERRKLGFRQNAQHAILKYCPTCSDHKGKPDNLYKLYVSRTTGAFFCHRCGNKGSWFDFKRLFGEDSNVYRGSVNNTQEKKLPDQQRVADYPAALFREFPAVLKLLTGKGVDPKTKIKQRELSEDVLKKYKVGAGKFMFRGDDEKWVEHQCVTFPWIDVITDKGGKNVRQTVQRIKVRSIKEKRFQKLEPAGGGWGLFGWHTVSPDTKEIVLTEGEFDAMVVHQETGLPAVSLPNGAHSLPIELLPRLERFEKIYLWMDDDIPGQEGAAKFAEKLGLKRVWIVSTKDGDPQGPKDANDALIAGKDLKQLLSKARRPSHSQVFTFSDIRQEVMRMITNPTQMSGVQCATLPTFNKILKGHRKGELTVFTGTTGVGKTTFLSQLSLDLAMQGVNTLWGSFEVKNVNLIRKMLAQYAGKDLALLEKDEKELQAMLEGFAALPIYYMRFWGSTSVEQVLDAMEYGCYVHDVEHILLDNLQFLLSGQTITQSNSYGKFDLQDYALESFRQFASKKNVHITLVIHPRKTDDNAPLTNASVFGSVKATQEADNVIMLQKGKDFKYLDIRKNRFDGELGSIPLRFQKDCGRFVELLPSRAPGSTLTKEDREKAAAAARAAARKEKEADAAAKQGTTTATAKGTGMSSGKEKLAPPPPAPKASQQHQSKPKPKVEKEEEEEEDEEEEEKPQAKKKEVVKKETKPPVPKKQEAKVDEDEDDEKDDEEDDEEEEMIRMEPKAKAKATPPPPAPKSSQQQKPAATTKPQQQQVAAKPKTTQPDSRGEKKAPIPPPRPKVTRDESKASTAASGVAAKSKEEKKPQPAVKKKVEEEDEEENEEEEEEEEGKKQEWGFDALKGKKKVLTDDGKDEEEDEEEKEEEGYGAPMGQTKKKQKNNDEDEDDDNEDDEEKEEAKTFAKADDEGEEEEYLAYMKQQSQNSKSKQGGEGNGNSEETKPKKKRKGLLG